MEFSNDRFIRISDEMEAVKKELDILEDKKDISEEKFLKSTDIKRSASASLISINESVRNIMIYCLEQKQADVPERRKEKIYKFCECFEVNSSLEDRLIDKFSSGEVQSHTSALSTNYEYVYKDIQDLEVFYKFLSFVSDLID